MRSKISIFVSVCLCICAVLFISGCNKKNGGINVSFYVDEQKYSTVKTDGKSVIEMPLDPEKNGYEFEGWFYDKDTFSNPFASNSLIENPIKKSIAIYADFSTINYSLSYTNTKGATNSNPTSYNVETSTINLSRLNKTGYVFTGWYMGTEKVTSIELGSYGNKSLEAKWSLANFSISYTNIENAINSNPTTYNIETTIILENPTKDGYTFEGWFIGEDEVTEIALGSTSNIELEAKWSLTEFDISYENVTGATNNNPTTYNVEEGTINLTNPTKEGQVFNGWELDGVFVETISTSLAKNITLAATWIDDDYLKYTKDGDNITITGFEDDEIKTKIRMLNIGETYDDLNVVGIAEGAFSGCSALESVVLPFVGGSLSAIAASRTTVFGYIFGTNAYTNAIMVNQQYETGSNSSEDYYIPGLLKSITITGGSLLYGSFSNCSFAKSITMPEDLESIDGRCFYNCISLISITIPEQVNTIEKESFKFCVNLESIIIPSSVVVIEKGAFNNCLKLKSVTMSSGVELIGEGAFVGCRDLNKVNFLGTVEEWCKIEFYDLKSNPIYNYVQSLHFNNELVTDLIIPDTVKDIKKYAFYGIETIENVTMSNNIETIGEGAFSYCSNLQYNIKDNTKYLGNDENPYLVAMELEYSFYTEYHLEDTTRVINSGCFAGIEGLTSIVLPDSLISISNGAFTSCINLSSISMPNNLKVIDSNAFFGCSNLANIVIPNSVEIIGYNAFGGLYQNITTVSIDSSIIAKDFSVYSSCGYLLATAKTVYILDSITTVGDYITENFTIGSPTTVDGVTYNVYTRKE